MDWKLEAIIIPVTDVARSRAFYVDQVGFTLDVDHRVSETFHVVQVTPPGSGCSVVFGQGLGGNAVPGQASTMQLVVSDVVAARDQLVARDVEVGEVHHFDGGERRPGPGGPWNSFVDFRDPDGNHWNVQERPAT